MILYGVIFVGSFFVYSLGSPTPEYVPGTPGSVWTRKETELVRKKVLEMVR